MNRETKSRFLLRALSAFCLAALPLTAVAQDEPAAVDDAVRDVRPGIYVGVSSCANGFCHGATSPQDETAVLQNEYPTWMLGPHRRARDLLFDDASQAIAAALDPATPAHEMDVCIACHSFEPPAAEVDGLYIEDGISCEACHGPAGGFRDRHFEAGWSYQESLGVGLIDLRNLSTRASVCLACHQGSERATVDHRLIAAGHPRLLFELDNMTNTLPRHWRLDSERRDRPATHGARAWAVGQASAFAARLRELERAAAGSGPWPEFSAYGCESCHHTLTDATWRRQPGYRNRGGLPRVALPHWTVIRPLLAVHAPGELEGLASEVALLEEKLAKMGDRAALAALAGPLAARIESLTGDLSRLRFNASETRTLMLRLVEDRETYLADLSSAEQLAFALQTLLARLVELDRRQATGPLTQAIDGLFGELEDPHTFDRGRFEERLGEIEGLLR